MRRQSKPNQGTRAVGYIRVSNDSQVDGFSLDAQRSEIERWCRQREYVLVETYADEGVSARTDKIAKRPALLRLLEDADLGNFDIVVVSMLNRWARNMGVQRQALSRLGEAKVGFASVTEDHDFTTPGGRLLLTMMGGVSEFFSDQLAGHVMKSQRERAEQGLPLGPVPFGYRTLIPGGVPEVVEAEGRAVFGVFQRRARGESNGAIANWLNRQGYKTRKDGIFTAHAVKDMLNCRFYLGKTRYEDDEFNGQHKPVITEELYDQVQLRKQNRSSARRVQGPKGLAQGMISCGNCGNSIQSDRHRFGGAMYRERHAHECATNNRSIMADAIDKQIETILTSVELQPGWRDRIAQLVVADHHGPDPVDLKERKRRLSRAYANMAFSDAEYETKLREIEASLRLTEQVELPTLEEAAQLFRDIPQLWKEATPEEQRKLLSPLLERVYVDMEIGRIGAIAPAPGFRRLLEGAMTPSPGSHVLLLSEDESDRMNVWSWWRRGRVELYLKHGLSVLVTMAWAGKAHSIRSF